MTTPDPVREAFEKALAKLHPNWTFDSDSGYYLNPRAAAAWEGWKAALSAPPPQVPSEHQVNEAVRAYIQAGKRGCGLQEAMQHAIAAAAFTPPTTPREE